MKCTKNTVPAVLVLPPTKKVMNKKIFVWYFFVLLLIKSIFGT